MNQFMNAKEDLVTEAIDGVLRMGGGCLARLDGYPHIKVVVRTDWGHKMFGTMEYYTESPFIDVSAAEWLVEQKPKAIAFDFFEEYDARRTDFDSSEFYVHHVMLGADVVLIEGLDNLDQIGQERFFMMALPIKIMDAEASPVRAIAIVD